MPDLQRYIGNVDEFPVLRTWSFFNHAGVAPLPRVAADAMKKYADEAAGGAYMQTTWYPDLEQFRAVAAKLINADADEIAFVKNTSEGINIVARGLDWRPGDRIVTTGVEYPANIYPWMEVARSHGAELVMVPEETGPRGIAHVPVERILGEAAHPRTKLVSLSHVEFASGQRHDIAAIGAYCRENGRLFNVDAIQSLGVVPVDVKGMNIDYLAADGHKWLLGPEGAGIFYCRRELFASTRPLVLGALSVINPTEYGTYDYTLQSTATRFESGCYNVGGLLALRASIELLLSIGIENIAGRLKQLTDRLIGGLAAKGYRVISPRDGDAWSGIVSFVSVAHDQAALLRTLRREHRIELALREGRLRCSAHFYNTDQQIDRLLELLPPH
jgi:selenocysteine lyase/cysteine desulfurase